jgi:hypothetical protein
MNSEQKSLHFCAGPAVYSPDNLARIFNTPEDPCSKDFVISFCAAM